MIRRVMLILVVITAPLSAAMMQRVDIPERIEKSDKVVVATPKTVEPRWETNSYGDKLIISRYSLQVEEDLKGAHQDTLEMDMEGGTLDGMTLRVSSLPELAVGERVVFFLDKSIDKKGKSVHTPHLKGMGILKLDPDNRVKGSSLRLEDIRRMAKRQR